MDAYEGTYAAKRTAPQPSTPVMLFYNNVAQKRLFFVINGSPLLAEKFPTPSSISIHCVVLVFASPGIICVPRFQRNAAGAAWHSSAPCPNGMPPDSSCWNCTGLHAREIHRPSLKGSIGRM